MTTGSASEPPVTRMLILLLPSPRGKVAILRVRGQGSGVRGQRSKLSGQGSGVRVQVSPGPPLVIQVNPAGGADWLRTDPDGQRVKGHFSPVNFDPGTEGRGQSEGGVRVDLPEVGGDTHTWDRQTQTYV